MNQDEIKRVRKALGMSQKDFAAAVGVSFATVNRWEQGHNEPQADRVARIRNLYAGHLSRPGGASSAVASSRRTAPEQLDFEGDPEAVKLTVDSYRLRNGHIFNRAYGLELSRVVPLPHQRIAVYENLLPQSPLRFLLADDAGAGKTIMTGLYILEMLNRGRLRRVLICCPAGLVFNWQRELRFFFELNFHILRGSDFRDSDPLAETDPPFFVVSVDTAAVETVKERLASPQSGFDLVVFDEAHKLSWTNPNRGESKTYRYKLAEALARNVPNVLLLTATPHMGKEFPFFALWRLLDPGVFSTPEALRALPAEKRCKHFIRRLKEEMVTYDGQPIYKPRLTQTVPVRLTDAEVRFYKGATEYLQWSYENNRSLNSNAAAMVVAVLQRRLASSTYAMMQSLGRIKEKRRLQAERKEHPSPTELDTLAARIGTSTADDSEPTEDGYESNECLEDELVAAMRPPTAALLVEELMRIDALLEIGRHIKEDAKFAKLRELIESPEYHREKVLIFTEHRDTLVYLQNQLNAMGYTGHVATIHGGMNGIERERQRAFFMPTELRPQLIGSEELARLEPPANSASLMVATDAAGEGINLQFAWIMVNYDIPWNPARLEQRMGRLHRFGQRHSEVRIFNLVAKEDTQEGKVLEVLLHKLEEARQALTTDKVFDVIGQQLPESSIRDLLLDTLMHPESDEWRHQIDAWLATQKLRDAIEKMRKQASKFGDVGTRIGQLQAEMDVEDFTHLLPAYVQNFVEKCAEPLGFRVEGDLSTAARLEVDPARAQWVSRVAPSLPDGLPEYLSVRRDPPPEELATRHVHFLRPGDPFFEALCDEVVTRFVRDTARGAVFSDPTTQTPYGVAFYVCQIGELGDVHGSDEARHPRNLLDRRLLAVKWDENGRFGSCAVNHLLALQAAQKASLWRAGRLLHNTDEQVQRCDMHARSLAESDLLQRLRSELKAQSDARMEDLARGFDYQAAELGEKRASVARKAREGDAKAQATLAQIKEQQARLQEERASALLHEQRRTDMLDLVMFKRIAVGLVLPDDSPEAKETYDANIEAIAIRVARNYEVDRYAARVIDVSSPVLARGYDLESHRTNGDVVAIEVKGRAGRGAVQLTENEWPTAINVRDRYWLYVVVDCAGTPVLYRVQDPAYKLAVKTRQSFTINFGDIVREAEPD